MYLPDLGLLLFIAPALLLGLWAQFRIRSTYAAAQQTPASLSGAAAARHILDSAGLHDVDIQQVPGHLTDHYDPRQKVLGLSQEVYQSRSMAAVGIAAHEAGHAIQDAQRYAPLVVRNAAVPIAGFGSNIGLLLAAIGFIMSMPKLLLAGIIVFAGVVVFQLVNLPVEFDASNRAKALLVSHGIVHEQEMRFVNKVLNAAALTYVAATLQAVLTLIYYIFRYSAMSSRDD
jgi:Zn-dependent membrane protease YugP